jgi:AmpE protein
MKLFIILICLGLERFLQVGSMLNRFHWFESYLLAIDKLFTKSQVVKQAWLVIAIYILPIVFSVWIIYWFTFPMFYGFVGLLFNLLILLYCLGPDDLFHQIGILTKSENKETEFELLKSQIPHDVELSKEHPMEEAILILANERFFAVLFWYIILGPVGAVLYRIVMLLRQFSNTTEKFYAHKASVLQQYLDWIPARLTVLFYLIVGSFQSGFNHLCGNMLSGPDKNISLIQCCAIKALGEDVSIKSATDLVTHSLVVILVIIAIFTLGAWIY